MDLTNRAAYLLDKQGARLAQETIDTVEKCKKKWWQFAKKHGATEGVLSRNGRMTGILFKTRPHVPLPGWRYDKRHWNALVPRMTTAEGKAIVKEMDALDIPDVPDELVGESVCYNDLPTIYYAVIHRVGKKYYVLTSAKTKKPPPHGKKIPNSTYLKHVENTKEKDQQAVVCRQF